MNFKQTISVTLTLCLATRLKAQTNVCKSKVAFSSIAGCPGNPSSRIQGSFSPVQCSLLCAQRPWCAAAVVAADGAACELSSADKIWLGWNSSCRGIARVSQARLNAYRDEFLAARNVTQKRLYIPGNSAKVFSSWLVQSVATSLVSCVDQCTRFASCRGVMFNSSNCSLLADFPLCRWFQQPPNATQPIAYNFFSVLNDKCFETVVLRVSDSVSFDRSWIEFRNGFGTYHGNYFAGLQWFHIRTSANPTGNQLRVDLLHWSDDYIYASFQGVHILSEDSNYTVVSSTYRGGSALGGCLFANINIQFVARDRGLTTCESYGNCAIWFQPNWHQCCHCGGPFGQYFNYPYALNVAAADRAKGIIWTQNAASTASDPFNYSFKQLEILILSD